MRILFTQITLLTMVMVSGVKAEIIHVPSDQPTIQGAIDTAEDGDTILVDDGIYTGYGNQDITTNGKAISIQSEHGAYLCTIDAGGTHAVPHRAFIFNHQEMRSTEIRGFMIRTGCAEFGGAIVCEDSSPSIEDCIFFNNSGWGPNPSGGAIDCRNSSPLIAHCSFYSNEVSGNNSYGAAIAILFGSSPLVSECLFQSNFAEYVGGAIYCQDAEAIVSSCVFDGNECYGGDFGGYGAGICMYSGEISIDNCLFCNHWAPSGGSGAYFIFSTGSMINCTFTDNRCGSVGGGIYVKESSVFIRNSIVWSNLPDAIFCDEISQVLVSYSDIENGFEGQANLQIDPMFVSGVNGNYYLSQIASGQEQSSLCVDAGSEQASEACFPASDEYFCLNQLSTRSDGSPDQGRSDLGYHYRCHFSVPTPTPTPSAHVYTPTPTATPLINLGVRIDMPHFVRPGDPFEVLGFTVNTLEPMSDLPIFFALRFLDEYWFWPSWSHSDPDYRIVDVPIGETRYEIVQPCVWPDTVNDTVTHIWFYGALLDPEMTHIIGQHAEVQWGFGPER